MFKFSHFTFLIVLLFAGIAPSFAQIPTYNMPYQKDTTVTDCKGEFLDNDLGPDNKYIELSDDIFRICTGGIITMTFSAFQLENGTDTLYFYNGSISPGNLIGAFTSNDTPTGIVATGCLVIHFKSSFVLHTAGWEALWTSTVVPPVPPTISISPVPSCNTTTVDIVLSKNIHCDSAYGSAFQLTGPINPTVIGATAISCVGDSTTSVRLQLSIPLTQNCDYNVDFTINMADNCDSIWTFTETNMFTMINCPLTVTIDATPNDTVCAGSCAQIEAVLNSCLSYDYTWSHGLPNQTTHRVCPVATTTYTVGVQSTSGGPTFNSSITITVEDPQITSPVANPVCQSETPFNLTATPPGGVWRGLGITDSILGTFDPDTSGAGIHTITYILNGLCSGTIDMNITEMDAGFDDAACPGSPAFILTDFTPAGGTWSGTGITNASTGLFDPATIGTYTVTYSHPNGCSDFKQVFVDNLSISATTDTVCQSQPTYTLSATPPGGRWNDVSEMLDTLLGIIDPDDAGPGLQNYFYTMNGCSGTVPIFIKEIHAGNNMVFCPYELPVIITQADPATGVWTSGGTNNGGTSVIQDGNTGLFDPGAQGLTASFRDTIIYTAENGCFDTAIAYVYNTFVEYDSLYFCSDDNNLMILSYGNTHRAPGGGVWTGAGVTYPNPANNNYYFEAAAAGAGIHTLTYNANGCTDTIVMVVYPSELSYTDTLVCDTQAPFIIDSIGMLANWQGQGIVDTEIGLFDPSQSGTGTFPIVYTTQSGCRDTIMVTIYRYVPAAIGGLQNDYCYTINTFPISLAPAGGTLTGTGIVGNDFSPSAAGEGQHTLYYDFGVGPCYTIDSVIIDVTAPITTTVTTANSPICIGDGATMDIISLGGDPNVISHTYTWSNGLFSTNTHVVSPPSTTSYTVTTSDGCSDDVVDVFNIVVNPPFTLDFSTSPINCDGTVGTADVTVTGPNFYSYEWSGGETSNSISGYSGSNYTLQVTDVNTGCIYDSAVTIPGYGIITALFSVNPSLKCIPYTKNTVTFIDLSLGATQGYWDLSDGTFLNYVNGENPQIELKETGNYTMLLHVENVGNCPSELSLDLCILPPTSIFVPDIFSPNGDGYNDELFVRGKGILELQYIIYDRWGKKIFETDNPDNGWDGQYKGKPAETGVYVWYLNATMYDDEVITEKGDVSLVR